MKRLLALFLVLVMLVSATSILTACQRRDDTPPVVEQPTPDPETPENPGTEDPGNTENPETPGKLEKPNWSTIIVPDYQDYGRDTVDFSDLVYEEVDAEQLVADFEEVIAAIEANEIPFEDQVALIVGLEDGFLAFSTAYTLASINNGRDSSNQFWLEQYKYITTNSASVSRAIEDMYVACAQSVHKESFETEYFGDSLDEYVDGGSYTDELVALLERESELIAQYNGFSTTNVVITLDDGTQGTVEELLASIPAHQQNSYRLLYMQYYMAEVTKLTKVLYIELIKIRMQIAEELGEENYATIAYEDRGHDYTPEQGLEFVSGVKYIYQYYVDLYNNYFTNLRTELKPLANKVEVFNDLYVLLGDMDPELQAIYSYMLQHGLYDYERETDNREIGAYTTYINSNNSPFIFISATGKVDDYVTLSHEFGHFADMYINNGLGGSLDLSEVYSQALSFLMLVRMEDMFTGTPELERAYKYMLNQEMDSIYNILGYQGYLAAFEHMVYELDIEDVTEENLENIMEEASLHVLGGIYPSLCTWDAVLIIHTIEYPFYVQSYATSIIAALEIMMMEANERGAGVAAFKALLQRDDDNPLTFEEELARAGIMSPLGTAAILNTYKKLYTYLTGKPA